jgi:hypothetical protein
MEDLRVHIVAFKISISFASMSFLFSVRKKLAQLALSSP